MADAKKNTAPAADLKAASIIALVQSAASAGDSTWVGGLPLASYTDVYNSDGSLKTFFTKASADKPDGEKKIGGRYVMDEAGREKKFYNLFASKLPATLKGMSVLEVQGKDKDGKDITVKYAELKGARFGVAAEQGEKPEDEDYAPITHPVFTK